MTTTRPAAPAPASQPVGLSGKPAPAVNPHWKSNSCSACHSMRDNKPLPIAESAVDSLCLSCHDGHRARQEKHPIGRDAVSDQIRLPAGWPSPAGKLGCATCHDIRRGCDHDRPRPLINPVFVRDWAPQDPLSFCGRCHVDADGHKRYNPHVMIGENHEIIAPSCGFCHQTSVLQRAFQRRTGRPELRMEEVSLCLGCHNQHPDYFEPGHLRARVPSSMKEYMRQFGTRQLPLAEGDHIVCSTCHNPHQPEVFSPLSELAYGAMTPGSKTARTELRGFGKDVCHACHDK